MVVPVAERLSRCGSGAVFSYNGEMTHTTRRYPGIVVAMFALLAAACGEDLPDVDCDTADPRPFAEVTLLVGCTGCHATTLGEGSRNGAPLGIDYDTYEAAVASAKVGVESVYAGRMPPVGAPEPDKEIFYAWALCGQPQ